MSTPPSGFRFICLMYHGLAESSDGGYTLSWAAFGEQLAWLQGQGYVLEGFGGLERRLETGDWPTRYVVLTFDDGHRSFLRAAEMLAAAGAQATFFLTRDLCRQRADFLKDGEIRQLAQVAEVGAHGLTHAPLTHVTEEVAREELGESKRWLEELVGREVRYMSAPGGYWNRSRQSLARSLGYSLIGNSVEWWNTVPGVSRSGAVKRTGLRAEYGRQEFARIMGCAPGFFTWQRARAALLAAPKQFFGRRDAAAARRSALSAPLASGERPIPEVGSKPLRVAYVSMQFPAPSETFAGTDIRALRAAGVDVRVFNLRTRHPEAERLLDRWGLADLPVEHATVGRVMAGCWQALSRPRLLWFAIKTILRDNWRIPDYVFKSFLLLPRAFSVLARIEAVSPDVVHLFWGHYPSLLGVLVKQARPARVVTLFLGAYDLMRRYRTSVTLARVADGIFTHAKANLSLLQEVGIDPRDVVVAYRGMDLQRFSFGGAPKVRFRIATAGRLVAEKGFREVVEVFAALKPRWPEASLTIIGEGPLEAELRQSVARHQLRDVTFLGWMDQRRLFDELCQAEVFLFLSVGEWERLPNVVKEAMAAHCVCVVARAVAIEELVQPDRHGFVVNLADRQAAVDAVTAVFQDPVLRESLVQRSLSHLNSSFDVRQSMKKYIEVWQRRLAERSGAAAPARAPADPTNAAER